MQLAVQMDGFVTASWPLLVTLAPIRATSCHGAYCARLITCGMLSIHK